MPIKAWFLFSIINNDIDCGFRTYREAIMRALTYLIAILMAFRSLVSLIAQ